MGHKPSIQQRAVYQWVRSGSGNLMLVAVAGAGKTTTILNASSLMSGYVSLCAYNTKISDELKAKLKGANISTKVQAGTFHSFGMRSWRALHPKVEVDKHKVRTIISRMKIGSEPVEEFVGKLVSIAKQRAMGVIGPTNDDAEWYRLINHYNLDDCLPDNRTGEGNAAMIDDGIAYALMALKQSAELDSEFIDFDDMILAPLAHNARIFESDWILVDEAQDTNPARRALAKRMLRPGGRAIFVGDPAQAIYGFTGADNDSLDIIKREFCCTELPLTVTYRCPKAVVAVARRYVSHITAADSAPEGAVVNMSTEQFGKIDASLFTSDGAMLCRNTAPLVAKAYELIRRGIACHVEGKAIGAGLIGLLNKWQTNDMETLKTKLDEYLQREVAKFMAKGEEQKAETLSDKVATLHVIISTLPDDATVSNLRKAITSLFGDTPEGTKPKVFTLSTVHKSKGREWKTVYLLDRASLMPSRFARQDWQLEQERNLIYVAVTRAQETLIEVTQS